MSYPKRSGHFFHRYARWLFDVPDDADGAVAAGIGQDATLLLLFVSSWEDAKRYKAPPDFYLEQIQAALGFNLKKRDRVIKARSRAVEAGLLHFIPPIAGSRKPGTYWVVCPELDDAAHVPAEGREDPGTSPPTGTRSEPTPVDVSPIVSPHEDSKAPFMSPDVSPVMSSQGDTPLLPDLPIPNTPTGPTKKSAAAAAVQLEIPGVLRDGRFEAVWEEWIAYRRERRLTVTPRTLKAQLADMAKWGPEKAIESINDAIRSGWQGVFEPKPNGAGRRPREIELGAGVKYDENEPDPWVF